MSDLQEVCRGHIHTAAEPKVSVCVVTYNQEDYIAQCLQSLVDQLTDFEFEVIVGNDCSTDGTTAIIEDFACRYPARVRHIKNDMNLGPYKNYWRTHMQARGEYIAHVDGDDYALPGKLQAQADALDRFPDAALAAHAVQVIGSDRIIGNDPAYPIVGTMRDLLRLGTYFAHSSVMYRRDQGGNERFPEQVIDYYIHIERAALGAIYLDKRVLGAYRYHASGLSGNPEHATAVERYYEQAFDRALALGIDPSFVERCRLERRMKHAIGRCLAGDVAGYAEVVALRGAAQWRRASWRHRLLSLTRRHPVVVHLYFGAKRFLTGQALPTRSA